MNKILFSELQLREWVEAAGDIKANFGADRALAYLVGEKFYSLVAMLHACKRALRRMDPERNNQDRYLTKATKCQGRNPVDSNDRYRREVVCIDRTRGLLIRFTALIREAFEPYEIRTYLKSSPLLGAKAHIGTEEEYEFLVTRRILEYSLESEIEDALILGDMMKYFGIT